MHLLSLHTSCQFCLISSFIGELLLPLRRMFLLSVSVVDNEDVERERLISGKMVEVCEMPAGTRANTLRVMLESERHTGIAGLTVEQVKFLTEDHSRALVTLSTDEGYFYFS